MRRGARPRRVTKGRTCSFIGRQGSPRAPSRAPRTHAGGGGAGGGGLGPHAGVRQRAWVGARGGREEAVPGTVSLRDHSVGISHTLPHTKDRSAARRTPCKPGSESAMRTAGKRTAGQQDTHVTRFVLGPHTRSTYSVHTHWHFITLGPFDAGRRGADGGGSGGRFTVVKGDPVVGVWSTRFRVVKGDNCRCTRVLGQRGGTVHSQHSRSTHWVATTFHPLS